MRLFPCIAALCILQSVALIATAQDDNLPTCSSSDYSTRIFFINGILTNKLSALQERHDLQTVLQTHLSQINATYVPPTQCQVVSLSYNHTDGVLADLVQAAAQLITEHPAILTDLRQDISLPSWATNQLKGVLQARSIDSVIHDDDLASFVNTYRTTLNGGQRVVVFGHSQGALYADIAYGKLSPDLLAWSRFIVVTAATPDSFVAGGGANTTAYEDLVATVLFRIAYDGRLGPTWTNTPASCEAQELAALSTLESPVASVLNVAQLRGLFACHLFDAYMTGRTTGTILLQNIADGITAHDFRPVAKFVVQAANESIDANGTVRLVTLPNNDVASIILNSADSFDEDGPILSHLWSIDVAPVVANPGASELYSIALPAGTHTVTLVVCDQLNFCSQPAVTTIAVSVAAPADSPPKANFSMTSSGQTEPASDVPLHLTADPSTGAATVLFTDTSMDPENDPINGWNWTINTQSAPLCTGTPTCLWSFKPGGPYVVTLSVSDAAHASTPSTATATITVVPAGPMLTSYGPRVIVAQKGDQSVVFAGTGFVSGLSLSVTLPGGTTVVLSGAQILDVTTGSVTALVSFEDPGRYTFTSTNPDGGASNALAIDVIAGPQPWANSVDAREQLDRPVLTADGSVRVMGNVYDCCGVTPFVNSFAADGSLQWRQPPGLDPDSFAIGLEQLLTVDRFGTSYVRGHNGIPALDVAGNPQPGWPVLLPVPPAHSQWPREALNPLPDPATGVTYLSTGGQISAYRTDGSLQWTTFFTAGVYPPLLAGGQLYAIVNGDPRTVYQLDRSTGASLCSAQAPVYLGVSNVAASDAALWTSAGGAVIRYDNTCQSFTVYPGGDIGNVAVFGGVGDVVLGFGGDSTSPTTGEQLFALGTNDVLRWTNPRIRQAASTWNPLRASLGSTAYVDGIDRLDGHQKLFAVDARTGEILSVLDTTSLCSNVCGVAASPDGTVYIGMAGNTLYKLQWPRFDQ